ncbi:D-tagatose-1,6-bisphosphate aldolase subunit GatY [Dyadobacter sp. CECT 9275]|uniref:D-tagatose-1,6-bisphosphate aldolase subunit GatY n=1 Tax=Dyadobacter helix TaxID=2822344 RepID=A0A916JCD9_9BACT|nr:class II fructose-bisphosphate aldolase [Dyadobacter sp. CECT 9275]CAG5000857.1 D-tagatose-1,6-bisphosphate aldolase subunit GatY [Dyadobacter sp. CECT 9275]
MPKSNMIDKLREMRKTHSSLLATNFYNYETLRGIMQAASHLGQPVILQLTKSSIDYMGLSVAVNLAKSSLEEYQVEGWLHLDHSGSYDLVHECLDAGFDSVMIDASEKSLGENIEITQRVVELAARYNANVEAELGYIAKLGQSKEKTGFTDPAEAKYFVEQTGINALAVAIGSAHGFYTQEPKLDMERLKEIQAATHIPLVLHGGSGIPGDSLKEAIKNGICKINLATEIKNIFMQTLKNSMVHNQDIDLRNVFPSAIEAVSLLVEKKLEIVKS